MYNKLKIMIKRLISFVFAMAFASVAFCQTVPFGQGYVINGEIKGDKEGFVTLRSYFRDGNERVDTAYVENGKFTFRSPIKEVIPALLTINGVRDFRIYLEPTTYTVKIDAKNASKTIIKGSKWTDEWVSVTSALKGEDFDVQPESTLADNIAADSVEIMEFVLNLEDEFGIDIPDTAIERFETLSDIVDFVYEETQKRS